MTLEYFGFAKRGEKIYFRNRCKDCNHKIRIKPENREKELEYNKIRNKTFPEKEMVRRARNRAKKLGLPFNLDISDIIIPKYCPILEIELKLATKQAEDNSPSIDRIDSTKGYVKGNVRVISKMANAMKAHANEKQLELFCKNILNYIKTPCEV